MVDETTWDADVIKQMMEEEVDPYLLRHVLVRLLKRLQVLELKVRDHSGVNG
jgi:hypothetical protein